MRDDPQARLALLRELYQVPVAVDRGYLPYRRAASAFMGWQLRRGLLNGRRQPLVARGERDPAARHLRGLGHRVRPRRCTSKSWRRSDPRLHPRSDGADVVPRPQLVDRVGLPGPRGPGPPGGPCRAVLHQPRARAGAVRARPGLRAPAGARPAGACEPAARRPAARHDRHLPVTGTRAARCYPLDDDLGRYVDAEHSLGHLLDVGIIVPRLAGLYDWSAAELGLPALRGLLDPSGPTPAYAWDPQEGEVWHPKPSRLARAARRLVRTSSA